MTALQAARKVFNTALSSLPSAAASSQQHAAGLALAFAECELRRGGNEARPRAVHVLAWLGTGGPFTAFKSPQKGQGTTTPPLLLALICLNPVCKPLCCSFHD